MGGFSFAKRFFYQKNIQRDSSAIESPTGQSQELIKCGAPDIFVGEVFINPSNYSYNCHKT
jgi:hypothetical protein